MMKRNLKMNLFPVLQLFHLSQRRYHGPLPELTIVQPATAGMQPLQDKPEPERVCPATYGVLRS